MTSIFNRIPEDIIREHILPYTYNTQSREHILDIQSYWRDYSIIMNYYAIFMNHKILLYDLYDFCFPRVIERYVLFTKVGTPESFSDICHTILCREVKSNIRFIFGLLNPIERTQFINEYILNTEEI
jgi:hypothetical protein